MDVVQSVKETLEIFQQLEPGITSAMKVGTILGSAGATVVRVIQKVRGYSLT